MIFDGKFTAALIIACCLIYSCGDGGNEELKETPGSIGEVETLENKNIVSVKAFESDNGKFGFMDADEQIIIPPVFEKAEDFLPEGIALVKDSISWKYIDVNGNLLVEPFVEKEIPDDFSEGLARFKSDGKFGYFDRTGTIVIRPQFDFADPFSEGLAAVCEGCRYVTGEDGVRRLEGGRWGYIDSYGNVIIEPLYRNAGKFDGGKAKVRVEERQFYIDTEGNEVN